MKKLTTIISCCCFCAIIGIGAWQGGLFSKQPIQTVGDAAVLGTKDWYGSGDEEPQGNHSASMEENESSAVIEQLDGYPAMIMVDGTLYYLEATLVEVDETAVIEYTTSYTDQEPKQHGETNFNRVRNAFC